MVSRVVEWKVTQWWNIAWMYWKEKVRKAQQKRTRYDTYIHGLKDPAYIIAHGHSALVTNPSVCRMSQGNICILMYQHCHTCDYLQVTRGFFWIHNILSELQALRICLTSKPILILSHQPAFVFTFLINFTFCSEITHFATLLLTFSSVHSIWLRFKPGTGSCWLLGGCICRLTHHFAPVTRLWPAHVKKSVKLAPTGCILTSFFKLYLGLFCRAALKPETCYTAEDVYVF